MATINIYGYQVEFDSSKEYMSIGVVGSGQGGAIWDVYSFDPASKFSKEIHSQYTAPGLKVEIKTELHYVSNFLQTGVFKGGNGARTLIEDDRPYFENGQQLLREVLTALGKCESKEQ